jgi:hypothetical protein
LFIFKPVVKATEIYMTLSEKIFGNSIGSFIIYAKDYLTGVPTAILTDGSGNINVSLNTVLSAALDSITTVPQGFTYKGVDRLTMAGANQNGTIPSGTKFAHVFAEAGDIRFAVNTTASATSAGYVIAGGSVMVHLVSATALGIFGATGTYANIVYYG